MALPTTLPEDGGDTFTKELQLADRCAALGVAHRRTHAGGTARGGNKPDRGDGQATRHHTAYHRCADIDGTSSSGKFPLHGREMYGETATDARRKGGGV